MMCAERALRLVSIYAIVRDNVVIYVGATFDMRTRPGNRYTLAVALAREAEPHRYVVLEMCVFDDQVVRERYYLELFRMLRHPLLNAQKPTLITQRHDSKKETEK
jgi:hypothetical protein